jgi:C-terminal processing protease CtpA/Prc
MTMCRYLVRSFVLLPLLLGFAYAEQCLSVDEPAGTAWALPGEDSGTSSYLGVDIAEITTARMSALKLKEEKGVEVTMVDQDAPAGKAGIKEHDVILTMNGTTIESGVQLRRMIHETPPGRMVTLGLSREGQPLSLQVQLADKHKEMASWSKPGDLHMNMPPIHVPDIDIPSINMVVVTSSARSGLMVENITQQLGEFFGVKDGNGVLIRSVEKGSRAEKAGFRAGDIIVKINNHAVHDTSDFSHAVKSRDGNSISVGVVRDKKEQTLNLSLPDKKESSILHDEESFNIEPLMQAEAALDMSEMQDKLAELRPQMELAIETSRKTMEKFRADLAKEQKQLCRQTQKQRDKLQKQMQELRQEMRHWSEDWL